MSRWWPKGLFGTSAALVACMAFCSLIYAPSASAEAFGELAQVGEFGSESGKFEYPIDVAVDREESNSAFVLDEPFVGGSFTFRVQKFGSGLGSPAAEVTIPTPEGSPKLARVVDDLAVDPSPSLHRLYALESTQTERTGRSSEYVGYRIVAYSTETVEVSGHKTLQLATGVETKNNAGVFYEFPLPAAGSSAPTPAGGLDQADGLAVNPVNHNLIVLGKNDAGDTVLQEITTSGPGYASGTLGAHYEDKTEAIAFKESAATGVAVGPDGTLYLSVSTLPGGGRPGVVELTGGLASPTATTMVESGQAIPPPPVLTGGEGGIGPFDHGAQVAVSPDGKLVYAAAFTKKEEASSGLAGSYEVIGFSASSRQQQVMFGGNTSGSKCAITSVQSAIAVGGNGIVYALDEGSFANGTHTPYGFHLIEFGPNGANCPAPATSFTIDKKPTGSPVEAQKGTAVEFEASTSELNGETPSNLEWIVTGPEGETVKTTSLTTTRRFLKPGVYTVELKMTVTPGTLGSPPPVSGKVEVKAPPPSASFEVFPSVDHGEPLRAGQELAPMEEVTFNAESSLDPAGGACSQASGCASTNKLKSYTWNFGDGSPEVTTSEARVVHEFANGGAQSLTDSVTLTVTSGDEVKSQPTTLPVTIKGTPAPFKEPVGDPITQTPPPPGQPGLTITPTPKPAIKPLTRAQKLANALKTCRKIKSKKARSRCEKAAKKKYAPPKHRSKKHK